MTKQKIYYDFKQEYEQAKAAFSDIADTEAELQIMIDLCNSGNLRPLASDEIIKIHEKARKLVEPGVKVFVPAEKKFARVCHIEMMYNGHGLYKDAKLDLVFEPNTFNFKTKKKP